MTYHPGMTLRGLLLLSLTLTLLAPSLSAQEDPVLVTVRPQIIDDLLSNPGMGWQHDEDSENPGFTETVAYPDRINLSWRRLNPEPDVYDWEILDSRITAAREAGQRFSFRVYTMVGESFGGHQVPGWVLERGDVLLDGTMPNYHHCSYQDYWGRFVEALRQRYDGHPDIAFIDISGYGNFNEWSWTDEFTEWDERWAADYGGNIASVNSFETLDGQARRRLVDMFIGGRISEHQCQDDSGLARTVAYDYPGFQQTQLVMPYAGLRQASQYAHWRRSDLGFRHDCLGRANSIESILGNLNGIPADVWPQAPVVYEFCAPLGEDYYENALALLWPTHASLIHDNDTGITNQDELEELLRYVGYRYALLEMQYDAEISVGGSLDATMTWANLGMAPSYPRMGIRLSLHIYIVDAQGQDLASLTLPTDIAGWMPAESASSEAPRYTLQVNAATPRNIVPGSYHLELAIIDDARQEPIQLAIAGRTESGRYRIGALQIR